MKAAPRVVLDTNVVLSALLFGGGTARRVRSNWQSGAFVPLASPETARELVRVLAYPKFKLAGSEQEELLADYIPHVQVVHIADPPPQVPRCRDPYDVAFLQLAVAGKAQMIVSGDKDLLALAGAKGLCPILTIDAFCGQVLGDES
ncbi:putative toxin-antitoxin system toxin component, PIN family [Ramlibacter albus]|uniref:Toxin-antitoxin system toxin component, PIN family n=1 Tax=Ramlibacter albus TaxID=2079448 RepID=A0A923M7J7_9BURK|nr:putative toxin-antitoxin system toxin component, PIN family [Ramlibacter albus]MBC5764012.1 putative toxin-antitoxin system toxin component, PIN family [Ramlibacter albus]